MFHFPNVATLWYSTWYWLHLSNVLKCCLDGVIIYSSLSSWSFLSPKSRSMINISILAALCVTRVRAIWSKVIRPGLQAGLDHFAPFSQHKQYTIQFMHHNLAIESLKYYNKVQTHSSTHTNVLKSTKIKFW
jgi:hypothetical protein